jgi:hypothetical protein
MLSLTPEEIRELLDDADKFTAKKLRLMAAAATNTDALPATSEEESRVPPAAAEPSVQTEVCDFVSLSFMLATIVDL